MREKDNICSDQNLSWTVNSNWTFIDTDPKKKKIYIYIYTCVCVCVYTE